MNWHNEPKIWEIKDDKLVVTADAKTDYWRVTLHDFIKDDAPFYYQTVTGDFTATVKVTGAYATLYDQAGLMVRDTVLNVKLLKGVVVRNWDQMPALI